ncbi:ribosomal protein L16 [Paracoccidioides brasiliensis Pb18]|uniref:Ribosomal protein L16 n=1 Tax=Paracoccidioides brasiliensis (strain Pb18) TaxID=502780 RepID=C1GIH4_PARBD|nr:ribosomal protein L16 [Paracoccidioides brasiliensis Pb18]EEH42240.1 ribosomal protein L16 [Paracoccidioides brasiliensis Pb18]
MGPRINIFQGLQLALLRPSCSTLPVSTRCFSTTSPSFNWLMPKYGEKRKSQKGRPRMPTGGSSRGTTVIWGDYGLRMKDHDRRVSADQLKTGFETIQKRLRGMRYKFYPRVAANIGVYTSGNEQRMGKGKGKFDYWAARVAVNRIIFELKGDFHEEVAREALRLAAAKMPGQYEFVKKGDPPMVGLVKLKNGVTLESLKRARREVPLNSGNNIPPPLSAAEGSAPAQ